MRKTKKDNDTTQSVCESEGGFIDIMPFHRRENTALSMSFARVAAT
jgi:hypothetical protein